MKDTIKILCPFCNAPYDGKMLAEIEEGSSGCESCGPNAATGKIEIVCSNCKKLVYKKEYKSYE